MEREGEGDREVERISLFQTAYSESCETEKIEFENLLKGNLFCL